MKVLGIGDGQESGAALVVDGEIIAAVNEERLNRVKLSQGYPFQSIETVLKSGGISLSEVDIVAVASTMTPCALFRIYGGFHARVRTMPRQFSYLLNLYLIYQVMCRKLVLPAIIEKAISESVLKRRLFPEGGNKKVYCIDHHLCHAYAAGVTCGVEGDVLVITVDGFGDGITLTVNISGRQGGIKRIYSQSAFSAASTYYSRLTEYLGFKPIQDEGKVMGLAAYGQTSDVSRQARNLLAFNSRNRGFNLRNYFLKQDSRSGAYAKIREFSREDIAFAFQKNLESEVTKFVSYWVNFTGIRRLALCGGVFANVKLNQRINELGAVDSVYIFPHMGDGGLSLGAALACSGAQRVYLKDVYLGPEYSDGEIRRALDKSGLKYRHSVNIEEEIAGLIAQNKVVARFSGRMEYGPRALGNRSILCQATDPQTRLWLNKRLKRTDFMPFAPSTLAEHAGQCYLNIRGAEYTARFLNISFDCTDWMKEKSPGAVHVDGTARPHFVRREDNPGFHKILRQYYKLTGIPSLVNTSFNMHEEPIVCSPEDAIKAFKESRLDYLAMGNYLARCK